MPKLFSRRKEKAGQSTGQHKARHVKGTVSAGKAADS